jgi:hypothetical protein
MRYLKTYKIFESEVVKTKSQLKRELWHKNNPNPTGKVLTTDEVSEIGVPANIVSMMSEWDIIYKSPYSKSFYSSDDISWSHKPDGSFRVSDHWNFKSNRDDRLHCKTDKNVLDNTHFSIGKYNKESGIYKIILSEPTEEYLQNKLKSEQKLKYLQDPDLIYKKRLFKDSIKRKEILVELDYNNEKISGILDKYTGVGNDLRIVDKNGNVIFTINKLDANKLKSLIFKYLSGEIVNDPFNI